MIGAAAVAAAPLAGLAPQAADLVRTSRVELLDGTEFVSALAGDLERDGRTDLLVVTRHPDRGRELSAHAGDASGVATEASWTLAIPEDVIGYAVADVTVEPGAEIVLLGGSGAFALVPSAPEGSRFRALAEIELVWQAPQPDRLLALPQVVRDLDGDGDDDLLLPEPDGLRVLRQSTDVEGRSFEAELLELQPSDRRAELQRLFESLAALQPVVTRSGPGELVRIVAGTPAPFVIDENGDGRLDVAVQERGLRVTWMGTPGGFQRVERQLPFEVDLERELDVSFASHLGDLDGDGRAESVLVTRQRRGDSDRTEVLVYGRDFERPSQVLILDGLVADSELLDVDGDGALDLLTVSLDDDLFQAIAAGDTASLSLTITVFAHRDGQFRKKPVLIEQLTVSDESEDSFLTFCRDATRDRGLEVLRRVSPTRLELLALLPRGDDWRLIDSKPLWTFALEPEASLFEVDGAAPRSTFASVGEDVLTLFEVAP